ncbi:MAG TPA: hypothetical protein V6D47_14405 [Oscillatoriaceae cyanobacterium]
MNAFEQFTRDFFETLGATVTPRGERLAVTLEPTLAEHFGAAELLLTFMPHDTSGELVAYGSHRFEQMLAHLATRGRSTACLLPTIDTPPVEPRALNGECLPLASAESPRDYFLLHYQLACVSDERIEHLRAYCLDAEGHAAPEIAEWLEAARGGTPLSGTLHLPLAVEATAETQVLAEADRLATELEKPLLERLHRVSGRLVAYYEELMADVPVRRRKGQSEIEALEAAESERWRLRRELEHKLAEETARHQLRVQVRRISLAQARVPGQFKRYRFVTRHAEREVAVWHNRHTGSPEWPGCQRCGAQDGHWGLCAEKHLVCETCLGHCSTCDRDLCTSELTACALCDNPACAGCLEDCTTGHAVCREHLAPCSCCGQAFCGDCLTDCPECAPSVRLASAHGENCGVCRRTLCASHRRRCAWCGGVVCESDTASCPGCGDRLCASHLGPCVQCGIAYCERCRDLEESHGHAAACRACTAVGDAMSAPPDWLSNLPQAPRYGRWTAIENETYRYLLGHGLMGDCLVVTDADGRPVMDKEIGFWRKHFGWGRP